MASDERIEWYRSPIDKDTLRELTEKTDLFALVHILLNLALYAATATLAFTAYRYCHWSLFFLAFYIHCMFVNFFYSPLHEMVHSTPFKTKWLNEGFIKICGFIIFANYVFIRNSHMHHHRVTVYYKRDLEIPSPRIYQRWHWLFFWTFMPVNLCLVPGFFSSVRTMLRHACGKLEGDLEHHIFPDPQAKECQKMFTCARITVAIHIVLITLFLSLGLWPLILIINFPVFFAAGFGQLCGMTQHTALIHSIPDFRLCCRTMYINPFLRFLYWNMNYHVEHHMYAAVPYYRLPRLRQAIQDDLPKAKVGLWGAWKEIIAAMKQMRKDPAYGIVPEVPNPKM